MRAILNTRSETLVVQKNMQFEARVEERLNELMRNCDTVPLMVLMQSAEMHAAGDSCVIAALQRMEAANKGMLREGIISLYFTRAIYVMCVAPDPRCIIEYCTPLRGPCVIMFYYNLFLT